jgi:hypothetical protein
MTLPGKKLRDKGTAGVRRIISWQLRAGWRVNYWRQECRVLLLQVNSGVLPVNAAWTMPVNLQ